MKPHQTGNGPLLTRGNAIQAHAVAKRMQIGLQNRCGAARRWVGSISPFRLRQVDRLPVTFENDQTDAQLWVE
jgi:hypothetical protein